MQMQIESYIDPYDVARAIIREEGAEMIVDLLLEEYNVEDILHCIDKDTIKRYLQDISNRY